MSTQERATLSLQGIRRCRENYYVSWVLCALARPWFLAARFIQERIRQRVRRNGVSVPLPNEKRLKLVKDAGVGFASAIYWNGFDSYEPSTSKTLRFFFDRVTSFVDVGANIGFYSLLAGLWNPRLRITAFEPVPETFQHLEANILANRLGNRISSFQMALSDRTGVSTFYLPPSAGTIDCEMTGTLVSNGWQSRKQSRQLEVRTTTFDDFEKDHPLKLELVKIDVEDFEASVLRGMRRTISRDKPFIVCEILPRQHGNRETLEIIESLGYTVYWIAASGYIQVSTMDFNRGTSLDFLLSPVSAGRQIVDDLEHFWQRREIRVGEMGSASLTPRSRR
jgi:FkbM family methyltransferase